MEEVGKRVVDELYVHLSALDALAHADHRLAIQSALARLPANAAPDVAKLNLRSRRVSLLSYPRFHEEAFPTLAASWAVAPDLATAPVFRSYDASLNPPILHRKELLVKNDHPQREAWVRLTQQAEELGLFSETTTIGFKMNWERLIAQNGYTIDGQVLAPLGNVIPDGEDGDLNAEVGVVQRHLTALHRQALSAPMQLLMRHGFFTLGCTVFDYGCGRGGDITELEAAGINARGWDPYYAPHNTRVPADVVNLGFVINVIEDPAERVYALQSAFALASTVLAVSVMLYPAAPPGRRFGDGFLTSRNTFQKYFSQPELKDYIEHVLHREPHMVGPGIAFIFASESAEQQFAAGRCRTSDVSRRLIALRARRAPQPPTSDSSTRTRALSSPPKQLAAKKPLSERKPKLDRFGRAKPILDVLWRDALELGRIPEVDEVSVDLFQLEAAAGSVGRAWALIRRHYDLSLLEEAAKVRKDDLRLFMAVRAFSKRSNYGQLEKRLQRDVRAFFGSYEAARQAGITLLAQAGSTDEILYACKLAAANGLGWLDDEHSLQLSMGLVDRLPVVLRAYIACGLVLWDSVSEVDMVKIHITSGKLTLLEHYDFDGPIPELKRRVKVNIRKLDYSIFEYGEAHSERSWLFPKSRYQHEDLPNYARQCAIEEQLRVFCCISETEQHRIQLPQITEDLEAKRLQIEGLSLVPSTTIPELDARCGARYTFRDFIECGQTQKSLGIRNVPLRPESYNALQQLAVYIIDPIVDYFGSIELTYGFCSSALAKCIESRIAPKLDQHASCEHNARGQPICARGGAACDFLVRDEDMLEVARWIAQNLPFDRLYFYGSDKPLHVSYSSAPVGEIYHMSVSAVGRLFPRRLEL
ncbi:DNA phosphorothioation-associated putative methyltransferase [Ramlibacter rhizophilus]|nr:DNA phosphorothioation-associated putative methyltransferase [Ramlibacter rhizophilus]